MAAQKKKLVMCQACRALIEPSEKVCPMCGRESVPARAWFNASTGGHFISLVILTINILLFVVVALTEMRAGRGAEAFVQSPSGLVLVGLGALYPGVLATGEWWRLVTWMFLHIGLMHLLFNSVALYQIGPLVEELYGSAKFIFIYLATGIFSGVASLVLLPSLTAGASGAIFGLIGLMAAYGYRQGGSMGSALMRQMLIWGGIGFVYGIFIGANNVAHAGGFVAGGALAFILPAGAPRTASSARIWNALMIACVLAVAASFAIAGRNFNYAQEIAVGGQNIIALSRQMHSAEGLLQESYNQSSSTQPLQPDADRLRNAARDITSVPSIDDLSDQLKQQYVGLLNKRADAIEAAVKNKAALPPATQDEIASIKATFSDYFDWEESVLKKYQLERKSR